MKGGATRWIWRVLFALTGAGVLAGLYAWLVERVDVWLDRFIVEVEKSGLPPEGLTILHLSDFHFEGSGCIQALKIARLQQLLADERYDLLMLTGDLIHDAAGLPVVLDLVDSLSPRLAAFSCPGNHDYSEYSVWGVFGHTWRGSGQAGRLELADLVDAMCKLWGFVLKVLRNDLVRLPVALNDVDAMHAALAARGVQPLVNQARRIQCEAVDLWVAGVDDLTEGKPDLAGALADVPEDALLLVLAHNPDIWLDPLADRADLVLAGHTHGGQIKLPGVGVAHTQGTHLTRQRPAGWFRRGAARMFVSRGLGESIPLRFGVRPQVTLIRLMPRGQG